MPNVFPQYSRGPGASSTALFGGQDVATDWASIASPFVKAVSGAFAGGDNAQSAYYQAQADKTDVEPGQLRQRDKMGSGIAEAFERAKVDPVYAEGLTQDVASLAARAGGDPKTAAGLVSLFISGAPEGTVPGMSNEQLLVNTRGAAGMNPLATGEAFNIARSQGNFDAGEATKRYGFDQNLAGDKYTADANARSDVESARIKAASDAKIAGMTTTTTTAPVPPLKPEDLGRAVNTALGVRAGQKVAVNDAYRRILARSNELYLKSGNLQGAVQQAVDEISNGARDIGGFLNMGTSRKVDAQPGVLDKPYSVTPGGRTTVKTVERNPSSPATAGTSSAPALGANGPGLKPGDIVDGFMYQGGDPNNPASWKPAA